MQDFNDKEFEFGNEILEKIQIRIVDSLAGENYLAHLDEINKMIDYNDLTPNLADLNRMIVTSNNEPKTSLKLKKLKKK